jgi:hypothetical protein
VIIFAANGAWETCTTPVNSVLLTWVKTGVSNPAETFPAETVTRCGPNCVWSAVVTVTGTGVGCVSLRLTSPGTEVNFTVGVGLVKVTGMAADRLSDSLVRLAESAVATAVTLSEPGRYTLTWTVKPPPSSVTTAGKTSPSQVTVTDVAETSVVTRVPETVNSAPGSAPLPPGQLNVAMAIDGSGTVMGPPGSAAGRAAAPTTVPIPAACIVVLADAFGCFAAGAPSAGVARAVFPGVASISEICLTSMTASSVAA